MAKNNNLTDFLKDLANEFRVWLPYISDLQINPQDFKLYISMAYNRGEKIGVYKGEEAGKEQGKQAEYDRFWNDYQKNGTRNLYTYAFAGAGWTKENLKPKYPIVIGSGRLNGLGVFSYLGRGTDGGFDMTKICSQMDLSDCTHTQNMFQNANVKNVNLDLSNVVNITNIFNGSDGGNFENITLKISTACTVATNAFYYAAPLTNLIFAEGSEIACKGFDFRWSKALSKASITSIINALSSSTTGLTVTFSTVAKEAAFTDGEWETLIATKPNWTIALA